MTAVPPDYSGKYGGLRHLQQKNNHAELDGDSLGSPLQQQQPQPASSSSSPGCPPLRDANDSSGAEPPRPDGPKELRKEPPQLAVKTETFDSQQRPAASSDDTCNSSTSAPVDSQTGHEGHAPLPSGQEGTFAGQDALGEEAREGRHRNSDQAEEAPFGGTAEVPQVAPLLSPKKGRLSPQARRPQAECTADIPLHANSGSPPARRVTPCTGRHGADTAAEGEPTARPGPTHPGDPVIHPDDVVAVRLTSPAATERRESLSASGRLPALPSRALDPPPVAEGGSPEHASPGCWPTSSRGDRPQSGSPLRDSCTSPSNGPWCLPFREAHQGLDGKTDDGAAYGDPPMLHALQRNKEQWPLHSSHSGSLVPDEFSSSSVWDAYGLFPITGALSPAGHLQSEVTERPPFGLPSSKDFWGICSPDTPAGATDHGAEDELGCQQSDASSPACFCTHSSGSDEEAGGRYEEDIWFPQLANCNISPSSEGSLSPPGILPTVSDEEDSFYTAPGDAEACESLGPCIAPSRSWGHHYLPSEGGPFSTWHTMGRKHYYPPRRPSGSYFLALGMAARRRSCPRAGTAPCCGARHASSGHSCGALAWATHLHEPGPGENPLLAASASLCRGADIHHCVGCAARQGSGAGGCCRRALRRSTCYCLRRCSRPLRFLGTSSLWESGDCRDPRGRNRYQPYLRRPCRGHQQPRRCPESCCCCVGAEGARHAPTAAAGDAGAVLNPMCCSTQYMSHDPPSQGPFSPPPLSRGRGDSSQAPQKSCGDSPLLLPGLCSRPGGGPEEGWQHRPLPPSLLNCSPEANHCFAMRRPSKTGTSITTPSSSLSPSGCLGVCSSRSSAGASSQPTLSPSAPSPVLCLHAKALARQPAGKGTTGETPDNDRRYAEVASGGPAPTHDTLLGSPRLDTAQQQQDPKQQRRGECGRCPCCCSVGTSCCYRGQQQAAACSSSTRCDGPRGVSAIPHCGGCREAGRGTTAVPGRDWPWCQRCNCGPPSRQTPQYPIGVPSSTAQLLQSDACSPFLIADGQQGDGSAVGCGFGESREEEGGPHCVPARGGNSCSTGIPLTPLGPPPWLAEPAQTAMALSAASLEILSGDTPLGAFIPAAAAHGASNSSVSEGNAPLGTLSGRPCPSGGTLREPCSNVESGEEAERPPGCSDSMFSEEAPKMSHLAGPIDTHQPLKITEEQLGSYDTTAAPTLSQSGTGGAAPEDRGRSSSATEENSGQVQISDASRPQRHVPPSGGWEAPEIPSTHCKGEIDEVGAPLEDQHGPLEDPKLCDRQRPSSQLASGHHEMGSSGTGIPSVEESACGKSQGLAEGPIGDGTPSGPKWLSSHVDTSPAACVPGFGTGAPATVQNLQVQDRATPGTSTSNRPEGSGTLEQGSCLVAIDGVKHECNIADNSSTQMVPGASGEIASAGVGGGSYKRKPAGTCCLPPPTQQRIVGLQPRPPPPRVYHVVMCTRRYWRVEWVSPETGRRVYKHFGENRYGGGDRAREVAVKFWAEVRKRSADGVERGEWQGLTEVTRRVREEGVEGILEEVRASPSHATGSQTGSVSGALPEANGGVPDETSLAPQTTATIEHSQQQHRQQGTHLDISETLGATAGGTAIGSSSQQETQAATAADAYRQRTSTLRASTRGRLLREASKDSAAHNSSRHTQPHSSQGEENPIVPDGGAATGELQNTAEVEGTEGQGLNQQQAQQQQQLGSDAFAPLPDFGDSAGLPGYARQQQQQPADDQGTPGCGMQMQQQHLHHGVEAHMAVNQLQDASLTQAGPMICGNSALEGHPEVGTGAVDWGAQPLSQAAMTPQLPLYNPAMGSSQGGGRLWSSVGDPPGGPQMREDLTSVTNAGDAVMKRESSTGTCSSMGGIEPAAKRYRNAGLDCGLSDFSSWTPSQQAYQTNGGSTSSGTVGSVPLMHPGQCAGLAFDTLGQAPMAPSDFPQPGTDFSTALQLSTGATQMLSTDGNRSHSASCPGDTPTSVANVQSSLTFQDMRGSGVPHIPHDYNQSDTPVGTAGGLIYAGPAQYPLSDPQMAFQQQHLAQQGLPCFEPFPLRCQGETPYPPQQQQHHGAQATGIRTNTAGSAVSSSRRSRCGVPGSSRKGPSGGTSGRSGSGGGSHGTRTIGRIYSLLVRGVRCWRAEWHDRTSGHRKTRQYAAPKHGEQQARALCLQALCQARSVPAQLLREAQQTFAYEPTVSPDQNSEPEEAPAESLPSTATYSQQAQQQNQLLQHPCIDQSNTQLLHPSLQRGEDYAVGGYVQAGYYWPSSGAPTYNSYGGNPPMLEPADQQSYGNTRETLLQHPQAGLYEAPVGGPIESGTSGPPAGDLPPHQIPNGCGIFPLDNTSTNGVATVFRGEGYSNNAPNEASGPSTNTFGERTNEDETALKQELPETTTSADPLHRPCSQGPSETPAGELSPVGRFLAAVERT